MFVLLRCGPGDGLGQLASALLTGLLVIFRLLEPLHNAFLIALFLKAPEGLFKWLVRFNAHFRQRNSTSSRTRTDDALCLYNGSIIVLGASAIRLLPQSTGPSVYPLSNM